jgi:chemotaxis protein CheX
VDSTYIMPFVDSIQKVFETMLQLPIQVGEPQLKRVSEPQADGSPPDAGFDVSGIIGMSGDVEGSVVLSFPTATAERVVSIFTGEELTHTHEDFPDAIGELINMISGGAKAQFAGKQVSISCPSVVVGSDHVVFGRKDVSCIRIPCGCDCGDFAVEVSIRNETSGAAGQTTGASAGLAS